MSYNLSNEKIIAAVSNFVKMHKSIRCTPAMAAGVVNSPWTVAQLVEMIEG